mgnify:FL=1
MREDLTYFELRSFLFGTRPTLLLATFGLAALSLPAVFTLVPAGTIESTIESRHSYWALGATVVLLFVTTGIIWSNCKSTYSPFLHRKVVPILITAFYVIFVGAITAIATFLYFCFIQKPIPTRTPELAVWSTIVSLYGFIVVVQITVRNFDPPSNRSELEAVVSKFLENCSLAEDSSNYVGFLDSIEENLEGITAQLDQATTPGGKKLGKKNKKVAERYQSNPTDIQIILIDSSRSPTDKELNNLKTEFESAIERLNRIS